MKVAKNDGMSRWTFRQAAFIAALPVWPLFWSPSPCMGQTDESMKVAKFDADPGWEGFRNRLLADPRPRVTQDFGYRRSRHAQGAANGEIGGVVQRSPTPAFFALPIPVRTLDDRLSASGRIAVKGAEGGSGAMVGWFHHETSRGWRTPNSLGFRIDGNGGRYWLFYEYGTHSSRTGGAGAFEGERYQTTPTKPFVADGTPHRWSLDYDPSANNGDGILTFAIDGNAYPPLPLSPGHRKDNAAFDRFGIWNVQIQGDRMELYLDDLVINGRRFDFSSDPNWQGHGNHTSFAERVIRPRHDFGFSPTGHSGRMPGEIGGIIFRDEQPAFYADKVGPFTLDHELIAKGRVTLSAAASDSGVCFGWFDGTGKRNKSVAEYEERQKNYLGIMIEGPSRDGHYFRAAYSTSTGSGQLTGPDFPPPSRPMLIRPDGTVHEFLLHYEPSQLDGLGRITVAVDDHTHTLPLRREDRQAGARFDRFGLFNIQAGGHHVEVYLDELTYSAKPADR